jgi:hypothetical protein
MNAKELSQTRLVLLLLTAAIVVAAIAVWPTPDAVFAADSDGDGLDDAFEQAFGTDPQASDSDDDNLTDFDEIFGTGTDPTDDDTDICQGTPSLSHLGDTYSYAPLVQENALEGAEGAVGDRSSFQGVRSLEHPLQFPQSVASALD